MTKTKLRRRHRPARKPKLPISNYSGFPAGMSHADLRRKFPIALFKIAEQIAASDSKIANCVKCFSKLPFRVNYNGF